MGGALPEISYLGLKAMSLQLAFGLSPVYAVLVGSRLEEVLREGGLFPSLKMAKDEIYPMVQVCTCVVAF